MKKTVVITGASSGIGHATAQHFSAMGWNVAATMRNPEKNQDLKALPNTKTYALDVIDTKSIDSALAAIEKDFGKIDVLVNNAGYGADGVFETMDDQFIFDQYNTNVFGLMRVTRAIIPNMRKSGGGKIIQVASMGGRLAFPLFSIYHGTKWAVEGFSESLQWELRQFNIQVKLIEPGAIKTAFYSTSRKFIGHDHPDYAEFVKRMDQVNQGAGQKGDSPATVAKSIFKAANSDSAKIRYATGSPAPLLLFLRKLIPDTWWFRIVRASYQLK